MHTKIKTAETILRQYVKVTGAANPDDTKFVYKLHACKNQGVTLSFVASRNSGGLPKGRINIYGFKLRLLRKARNLTIEVAAARLQLAGWDVGETSLTPPSLM